MANRKDGSPKRGSGLSIPRVHAVADLIGRSNRSPSLIESEFWPIIFKRGFSENRVWHDKGLQELLLASGWKEIHPRTIEVSGKIPELHWDYFFIDFPLSYARSRDRYSVQSARIYPGRIEMPKCRKAHRCGIIDIASENPFRAGAEGPRKRRPGDARSGSKSKMELVIEKSCPCFNESERDHEGSIFLYHRG